MEIPKVVGGIPEVRIVDKASVIWRVASGAYMLRSPCNYYSSVTDLNCGTSLKRDLFYLYL